MMHKSPFNCFQLIIYIIICQPNDYSDLAEGPVARSFLGVEIPRVLPLYTMLFHYTTGTPYTCAILT